MQQHVTILSWIYIIFVVLGILGGFGLLFVMLGAGALAHDRQALLATGIIGFVIAGVLVVLSLPSLLAGWGLTKRREWARILTIVIAVLGIVMLAGFGWQLSSRLSAMDLNPGIRQEIESQRVKLAAIEIPREIDIGVRQKIRQAIDESFVAAFRLVMLIASGLVLLSAATASDHGSSE